MIASPRFETRSPWGARDRVFASGRLSVIAGQAEKAGQAEQGGEEGGGQEDDEGEEELAVTDPYDAPSGSERDGAGGGVAGASGSGELVEVTG